MMWAKEGGISVTLGEIIYQLRKSKNMSQDELAAALEVSRQSVSKWENNSAVPELEKLTKMSNLFGVTLDELVLGKRTEVPRTPEHTGSTSQDTVPAERKDGPNRTTVGVILLCFGAVTWLLLTIMGGFLMGLIFASPFFLCGTVCLVFRKNVGLWCAWSLFFAVNTYLRWATGIRWSLTLWTLNYEPSMNYTRLVFAWIELICINAMMIVTILRFQKKPLAATRRNQYLLIGGWIVLGLLFIPTQFGPLSVISNIIYIFTDWIRLPLLTALITNTLRLWRRRKVTQGYANN